MEGIRKLFGILLCVSISTLSTYFIVSTLHSIPGGIILMLVIVSVSGFIGGFVSRDMKTSFLAGLLAGFLTPLIYVSVEIGALHVLILRFALFGLVSGIMGVCGAGLSRQEEDKS